MSIVPVAIVAGVWYHLARQGVTTQTIWSVEYSYRFYGNQLTVRLGLNVLDSMRALRTSYPNGRSVGTRTRRRAMREAMLCWTAYVGDGNLR